VTQASGACPALYDGVGAGKKKKKPTKRVSAFPGVKAKLDNLRKTVKG
jgi:hypothetical protein